MRAAIIGSGAVHDYKLLYDTIVEYDLIICADGGINHLIKAGVAPNVFIGDFDSCEFDSVKDHPLLKNCIVRKYNTQKNDTDMQLCIDYALKQGCTEITLFAALGGRADHELSNIFNLKYILENGAKGLIFSDNNLIYITDSNIKIERREGFKISLLPLTAMVEGISSTGLYYPLKDDIIYQGTSLGISNEFTEELTEISIKSGTLLIILSKDE